MTMAVEVNRSLQNEGSIPSECALIIYGESYPYGATSTACSNPGKHNRILRVNARWTTTDAGHGIHRWVEGFFTAGCTRGRRRATAGDSGCTCADIVGDCARSNSLTSSLVIDTSRNDGIATPAKTCGWTGLVHRRSIKIGRSRACKPIAIDRDLDVGILVNPPAATAVRNEQA